ncbi:MBOAT family protein [Gemella sp. GH3]|uniref:MBOAT family O-acyltransferase n=1 Tax=unclassified Gemella TaxID=2624949 RepID=UPI0015D00FD3|nr:MULTISPECIES: MBOAT family protein [unclassified Gemella]MBF0713646.1 MBOAT family protein [Gemella sp. GH3.1]NYS50598.1 MBOAT family protein [Gemella sp. GH3]
MAFTVSHFIFAFLPLSVLLYYILNLFNNKKLLNIYLIMISLVFYATSSLRATLYLFAFITIIYIAGYFLDKYKNNNLFLFSLVFVILILSYFKYASYVISLFREVSLVDTINIIVPLGMSFIAFESISYLVDIYTGKQKRGNIIETFLFFTFFPKITSGPIVLWRDFYSQITSRFVSVDLFFSGLERIMIGFIKKCLIADNLGNVVFNISSSNSSGIDWQSAILGALCYFLQLYYDFSGYSDIAIGISRLFGFDFKENFNYPYIATSVGEFWRRWHISLGTWFRTYIYIPLGGNRKNVYLNLFIVFLLTGMWHGSTFNFVLWGILHGFVVMFERLVRNKNWYLKIPIVVKWLVTMIIIYLTWIIFMLPTFFDVLVYFKSMIGIPNGNIYFTYEYYFNVKTVLIMAVGLIGAIIGKSEILKTLSKRLNSTVSLLLVKEALLIIFFVLAILEMMNSSFTPFLYFQF